MKIHYPYHPLKGKTYLAIGCWHHKNDKYFILKKPDNKRIYIPAWMTESHYSQISIVLKPVFHLKTLRALKRIIDISTEVLHYEKETKNSEEQNDNTKTR